MFGNCTNKKAKFWQMKFREKFFEENWNVLNQIIIIIVTQKLKYQSTKELSGSSRPWLNWLASRPI